MTRRDEWQKAVGRDAERLRRAGNASRNLLGLLLHGGTLGLLFVVPVVGGAYLGRWIDTLMPGYSVRWTVSCVVLGIVVGGWNVQRFIRTH